MLINTSNFKNYLKENKKIMYIFSEVYTLFFSHMIFFKKIFCRKNAIIFEGAFLKNVKIDIRGSGNHLYIGEKVRMSHCEITIIGNNCCISIGGGSSILNQLHLWCEDNNSAILIGRDFTIESGHIAATEGGKIIIGDKCMFSSDIEIRNGDSHSILSLENNVRLNFAKDVQIADSVWLAAHVRVMKGSIIPKGCVIGNSSIVSSVLQVENSIYAGVPCKLIKENIFWNRFKVY